MPARRLLVRKIREVLRLKHERGSSHRAIAQACAIGVGTVSLYLRRAALGGLGWPPPVELTTRRWRPGCSLQPPRCTTGSSPTARTSTASSSATVSRCSSSGRSTPRSIRTATGAPSSARSTGSGRDRCGRRCARSTAPARRRSSTSRGSGRRWSTPARACCGASSCSSPCSARATSPTPGRRRPSSCPTGSTPTSAWPSTSAADRLVGPRPAQERHHPALPLRAGRQSHLRGPRRPLRRRPGTSAAEETQGQSRRGGRSTPGPAVDTRPAPRRDVLRPRRPELN